MELSRDEWALLLVGVGYLAAVAIWALSLHLRARILFRRLSELIEPRLWQSLGAPDSVRAALRDPDKRWFRFLRSGDYRRKCSDAAIELIDDYRRATRAMLVVLAGGGLLLLVRFWPILKPEFLA